MASIGYDRDGHIGIHGFDPAHDVNEIATVDGISIVAAKREFSDLPNNIRTYSLLEKLQGQLTIQQCFGHFSTRATRTSQSTDAAQFHVPMVPGQQVS
jgi:hypothetical protein